MSLVNCDLYCLDSIHASQVFLALSLSSCLNLIYLDRSCRFTPMRTTSPSLFRATNALNPGHRPKGSGLTGFGLRTTSCSPCRSLAQVQSHRDIFPEIWLPSSTPPRQHSGVKYEDAPPDERTLKLGKSTFHSVTLSK